MYNTYPPSFLCETYFHSRTSVYKNMIEGLVISPSAALTDNIISKLLSVFLFCISPLRLPQRLPQITSYYGVPHSLLKDRVALPVQLGAAVRSQLVRVTMPMRRALPTPMISMIFGCSFYGRQSSAPPLTLIQYSSNFE
jgi:hypothetical protein